MNCQHCGHENPDDANFCASCGTSIERAAASKEESTITFNPVEIQTSADDVNVSVDDLPPDSAMLVVKRGDNAGSQYLLSSDHTKAGRHPDSDIFLDDITVSRLHAEISRENGQFKIKDSGSLNGTYLNHERIDEKHLSNGDELQIGKFKLVFLSAKHS